MQCDLARGRHPAGRLHHRRARVERARLGCSGRQHLSDGSTGRPYWIFGFMAEKLWKSFSLYVNFENFTDTRQTRFESIYNGPVSNPVFRDIYAPLDGFVVNGGLKLKL